MKGTSFSVNAPILFIPPTITTAVITARAIPVAIGGMENVSSSAAATEFDCVMLPIPKAANAPKAANI